MTPIPAFTGAQEEELTRLIAEAICTAAPVAATAATTDNEEEDDPLDNEAVDKESRRWQDGIRDKLIDLGVPDHLIDGAGCDSGDPLDFTLAEVGQGVGYFIDQIDELKKAGQ